MFEDILQERKFSVKELREHFKLEPEQEDSMMGYVSNIAMLLHDNYGITDYEKRNQAAEDILKLIFWG